jgi:hypothetical protein
MDAGYLKMIEDGTIGIANGSTISAVGSGFATLSPNTSYTVPKDRIEEILDMYDLNQIMCEHKLAEFELMKLRTDDPNYTETIKTTIANKISGDVVKKVSFTMKKDKDADVNYFRGRAYVFTKQELIDLIKEVRSV